MGALCTTCKVHSFACSVQRCTRAQMGINVTTTELRSDADARRLLNDSREASKNEMRNIENKFCSTSVQPLTRHYSAQRRGSVSTNLRKRIDDTLTAHLYGLTLAALFLGVLLGAGLVTAVRR